MLLRTLRNLGRLVEIAFTLARHDALFPLDDFGVAPGVTLLARPLRRKSDLRPGQRLAAAFQSLGPTFIKLGQALATRSDLVGEEMAEDLSALQDNVPPFPYAKAKAILEEELGRPLDALFKSFNEKPVAAASIAQVHHAITQEGDEVAVKILRPGVRESFGRDIDLLFWIAELTERTQPALRRLKPVEVIEVLEETTRLEMDLRFEAAACAELGDNFAKDQDFRIPRVDWQRTSNSVFTLEWIHGIRIDRLEELNTAGHDPREILRKSAEAFFKQVFRDGYFHADIHPGNMFIEPDGTLVPIDFGIMGRLDRRTRYYLADMLLGFLNGDYRGVAEVHFRAGYVPQHKSVDYFTQACRSIGEPILGKPMNEISVGQLLAQLFQVTEYFEMETQPQLLLLQKTMVVAEGVGRILSAEENMWLLARPLVENWMRQHRGPQARLTEVLEDATGTVRRLPGLVRDLERVASSVVDDGLRLSPETLKALAAAQHPPASSHWALTISLLALAVALLGLFF